MKNLWKNLLSLLILSFLVVPGFIMFSPTSSVHAQNGDLDVWGDELAGPQIGHDALNNIGMGKDDPRVIAANIIKVVLGLLGLIAVVIILLGGFKWMTASGNEDKVTEAKKLLGAGIIGLLIVLAAWALAMYIIGRFLLTTGANFEHNIYAP